MSEISGIKNVKIIFATLTGNSQLVADLIGSWWQDNHGIEPEVLDAADIDSIDFLKADLIIPVVSTWGEGDQNPFGEDWLSWLQSNEAEIVSFKKEYKPKAAYVGLGESFYEQFANAIHSFSDFFNNIGLEQVGEIHKVDGIPEGEEEEKILAWLNNTFS